MKKGTLIIWVVIFGFMALVIFQNKAFFLESKTSISLNLGIAEPYQSPELANALIVLCFFVFGCIVAYLFGLSVRFKTKRSIKKLSAAEASHEKELTELKDEVTKLKSIETPVDENTDAIKLGMDTAPKIDAASPADKTLKLDPTKEVSNPGEHTGEKKKK
ncbi:MAG: LapA family protein [bacterium]|nr:LapA family protein [bacterium]